MEQTEFETLDEIDVYKLIRSGQFSLDDFNEWLTFFEESIEYSKFE